MLFAAMAMIMLSIPIFGVAPVSGLSLGLVPVLPQSQRKAVILSSLEELSPMGAYRKIITADLEHAGYQVTFVNGSEVTIDFLLTQLNNYSVIIWRTNTFMFSPDGPAYWYVGEMINAVTQQKYASDFAQGWIIGNAGILGVDVDFFTNHYSPGSLSHVKVILLISSNSAPIGQALINANARSVVICNGAISLQFGTIDDLTGQLVSNLANGNDVYNSVYNTIDPYGNQPRDPLDTVYTPPFWFLGDGTVTIT